MPWDNDRMVSQGIENSNSDLHWQVGKDSERESQRLARKANENQMGFMQHWEEMNFVKPWIGKKTGQMPGVHHRAWDDSLTRTASQWQVSLLHGHLSA